LPASGGSSRARVGRCGLLSRPPWRCARWSCPRVTSKPWTTWCLRPGDDWLQACLAGAVRDSSV